MAECHRAATITQRSGKDHLHKACDQVTRWPSQVKSMKGKFELSY